MAERSHTSGDAGAVPRWWGWTAAGLSVAGLAVSVYLTVDHFTGTAPLCAATGVINCAKVTTSPQSSVAGVPVAVLGLAFFAVMAALNLPRLWQPGGTWHGRLVWARLGLALAGTGFVVWLVYAELVLIKAVCLWCTVVHVCTVLLFVLVVATFSSAAGSGQWDDPAS